MFGFSFLLKKRYEFLDVKYGWGLFALDNLIVSGTGLECFTSLQKDKNEFLYCARLLYFDNLLNSRSLFRDDVGSLKKLIFELF